MPNNIKRLFVLVLSVLSIFAQAQINDKLNFKAKIKKTDLELSNLYGKVKSYREEFFVNDQNIGFKRYYNYFSDEYQLFNTNGYLTTRKLYDKNGNTIYKANIDYGLNNKINSITEYDSSGTVSVKTINIYDSKDLLIETKSEDVNSKPIISKLTYNSTNLVVKEDFFSNDFSFKTSYYSYDEAGSKTVIDSSLIEGSTTKKYKSQLMKFDWNDNMLEQITYETNGGIILRYEYTFDKNNNNIVFSFYGVGNVLEGNFSYKFDEKNNMIEEDKFLSYKNKKESIYYEYKFDTQGNWIEKTTKHHNIPKNIVKRELQYY